MKKTHVITGRLLMVTVFVIGLTLGLTPRRDHFLPVALHGTNTLNTQKAVKNMSSI